MARCNKNVHIRIYRYFYTWVWLDVELEMNEICSWVFWPIKGWTVVFDFVDL